MHNKYGKLFKCTSTKEVTCLQYDVNQNYYAFVQDKYNEGYHQCIVTSDIMIKIMQHFVLEGNVEITSMEFMVEDEELESEISSIISLMKQNAGYWEILKQKIAFLSQNDCIEVKKANFRGLKGQGFLFSIQANGIVVISESDFDTIAKTISKIMEGCIK